MAVHRKRIVAGGAIVVVLVVVGMMALNWNPAERRVDALLRAWNDRSVTGVAALTAGGSLGTEQEKALSAVMVECVLVADSARVWGGVSPSVKTWGAKAQCGGNTFVITGQMNNASIVSGRTHNPLTDDWLFDANYLPGGDHSDWTPTDLPGDLAGLPRLAE